MLQKLEPLFPPADQVQSLNLRAALLRSLEQVKKNGYLGRDAVIRKTMLDECKGDRLEEVLATFSFAVVRKVFTDRADETGEHAALAQALAMENRGYTGERTELAVLKLAHQAVLSKQLREKNEARELYRDFSELLDIKRRSITRRREQVKTARAKGGGNVVTEDEKLDVWRLVRNNWAGNERWMETLLYGDANSRRDGLLSTPFDKVWRRVRAGRLSELDDRGSGLMEQLDSRVRLQQDRLRKWEGFRKSIVGDASAKEDMAATDRPKPREGLGLKFADHQSLHLSQVSPQKKATESPEAINMTPEYANLIAAFERDLHTSNKPKAASVTSLLSKMPAPSKKRVSAESLVSTSTDVISELEDLDEDMPPPIEPVAPPVATKLPRKLSLRKPGQGPTRSQKLGNENISRPRAMTTGETGTSRGIRMSRPPSAAPDNHASPPVSPTRTTRPYLRERSPTKELIARQSMQLGYTEPKIDSYSSHDLELPNEPPKSPTQQQADDILASVSNASPSPTKRKPRHVLSLDERTRLSMASSRSRFPDDEEDDMPPRDSNPPPAPEPIREDDRDLEYEDIVARTRRSMVGFEAARQKAQLERRRSARKSRREGSQFYKAAEQFHRVREEHEESALAEELMEGDQSYEDVFMSRPKIQASPIPSPTMELEEEV